MAVQKIFSVTKNTRTLHSGIKTPISSLGKKISLQMGQKGVYILPELSSRQGKKIIKFSKGKLEEMMQGQISIVLPFLPILPSHCLPFYFIPFPSLTSSFYKWKIIKAQVGVSEKNQKSQKNIHP